MARTARKLDTLAALKQLSLARNREAFAVALEQLAADCVGGGRARFYRYRHQSNTLLRPWESYDQFPLDEDTLPGKAALYMEFVTDAGGLPAPGLERGTGLGVAFPVRMYGAMMGIVAVVDVTAEPGPEERASLDRLGELAGVTWETARRTEDHQLYAQRVEDLLVSATESLTPEGQGHTMRVARLATELANLMDLSAQSRNLIWRTALYHDVGKLVLAGRPAHEVERDHPSAGAEFLRSGRVLRDVAHLVEAHHERWDGSGFPHGLRGDDCPVEAWVLALAEHLAENPEARQDVERFLATEGPRHHPAVVDALGGLLVSGTLGQLLA
ncbi:MAG: HD domain-containing protein [Candidatus Eremiobacterota bacterium]